MSQIKQRSLETLRVESERCIELEADKTELEQKLTTLHKQLDGQKVQKLKLEQMEFEVIDVGNENQVFTLIYFIIHNYDLNYAFSFP